MAARISDAELTKIGVAAMSHLSAEAKAKITALGMTSAEVGTAVLLSMSQQGKLASDKARIAGLDLMKRVGEEGEKVVQKIHDGPGPGMLRRLGEKGDQVVRKIRKGR
jgi:hypothetical protein